MVDPEDAPPDTRRHKSLWDRRDDAKVEADRRWLERNDARTFEPI